MNLLTINVSKTTYVIFSAKNKKINANIELKINNKLIKRNIKEKYLGIVLDNHLTWKPQIEKIKSKLLSLTGALCGNVRCFPKQVRYFIYNSLVKPHIDYLIEVWGTASKSSLKEIQIKQNKLLKILFGYNFRTSTDKIYKETRLMDIKQSYEYSTCILIRKILNKNINTAISFKQKSQMQRIKLRSMNNLVLRPPRTNYGKNNIEYEGAKLYNKLPNNIKNAKTMSGFKKMLKSLILSKSSVCRE